MNTLLKRLVVCIAGEYESYRIFCFDSARPTELEPPPSEGWEFRAVDGHDIGLSDDPLIRDQAWYAGAGARGFACLEKGRIVGLCIYWFGERCRSQDFWPLNANEAT